MGLIKKMVDKELNDLEYRVSRLESKNEFLAHSDAVFSEDIDKILIKLNQLYDENKRLQDALALANERISDLEKVKSDSADYQTAYNEWMENPIEV